MHAVASNLQTIVTWFRKNGSVQIWWPKVDLIFPGISCSWGSLLLKNPSKERHDVVQWYVLLNSCSFLKFFTIFRVNYHIPAYVDFFIYIAEYLNQQSATLTQQRIETVKTNLQNSSRKHTVSKSPFLQVRFEKGKEPLNTKVQKTYSFEANMTHHHSLSVSSPCKKRKALSPHCDMMEPSLVGASLVPVAIRQRCRISILSSNNNWSNSELTRVYIPWN